jgi:hypothetical protein
VRRGLAKLDQQWTAPPAVSLATVVQGVLRATIVPYELRYLGEEVPPGEGVRYAGHLDAIALVPEA